MGNTDGMPMNFRQMHNFMVEVWQLYQEYVASDLTDDDIESFTSRVEGLRKDYLDCAFAVDVLVALVCEVERVEKIKNKILKEEG